MLVDIIIPAHNPGKLLNKAIDSCLKQTYKNYNIIVVDDASSEDVLGNLIKHPKVSYIRNDKNVGPAESRNIGIRAGSGDLISLLDADDFMCDRKLKLSVQKFKDDPSIGLTCGNYKIFANNRLMGPFYKKPILIDHKALLRINYVASGSTTFSRAVVNDIGLFDSRYWIAEDYDYWLRISEKYKIEYIHDVLYYYTVVTNGKSLTQRADIQNVHNKNLEEIRAASIKRISGES